MFDQLLLAGTDAAARLANAKHEVQSIEALDPAIRELVGAAAEAAQLTTGREAHIFETYVHGTTGFVPSIIVGQHHVFIHDRRVGNRMGRPAFPPAWGFGWDGTLAPAALEARDAWLTRVAIATKYWKAKNKPKPYLFLIPAHVQFESPLPEFVLLVGTYGPTPETPAPTGRVEAAPAAGTISRFCSNCGNAREPQARFCSSCGSELR